MPSDLMITQLGLMLVLMLMLMLMLDLKQAKHLKLISLQSVSIW